MNPEIVDNSSRFTKREKALRYPSEFRSGHGRDEREKMAIIKALAHIPTGARILDLPCGSGRLTKILYGAGYRVVAADYSMEMLKVAQANYERYKNPHRPGEVAFTQRDIFNTGFGDNEFEAVVCHRLFHHLFESETRKRALGELYRITRKVVIVSFFNSFSLSALIRKTKYYLKGYRPTDRVPIKLKNFAAELHTEKMEIKAKIAVHWAISPLWLIVAKPCKANKVPVRADASTSTRHYPTPQH